MELIFLSVISYLIGSFPSAYILMKKLSNVDIREKGSGNVGAMNAFDISGSAFIGIIVFILDFSKGFLTVYIARLFFPDSFIHSVFSLNFVVLGHCFPIWLKFKGGRGLATASGGSLLFVPAILIIWLLIWIISYLYKKNVLFSNITASFITFLLVIFNTNVLKKYSFPLPNNVSEYIWGISIMLLITIFSHSNAINDYIKNLKIRKKENE